MNRRHRRGAWPCPACGARVRERPVLIGPAPGVESVMLLIDVEPHPAGEVVRRNDGAFRLLAPHHQRVKPVYRIHDDNLYAHHACTTPEEQQP